MARLVVSPEGEAKAVSLAGESVSLGRDPSNAIPLAGESKASRRHAQVVPISGGWEVVDLDSTNGTRVNGDAVKRRRLAHGDVIEVGTTRIRYEDEAAAAKAATTKDVCYLEHAGGDRRGERIPLSAARTTFGRRESNTVPLADKMASGHHAEIVKDLNGYTIRDLGSTNGTLVNGEPTTEAPLAHGARIRIGNSRFVFKDPSMADVDVELAGLPDEEAGWGMMAEIDVGRARGGGAGGLLGAAALVAGLAGLAWWAASNAEQTSEASQVDVANLVTTDPRFDSTEGLAWTTEEGAPVHAARVERGGRSGGALVVRWREPDGEPVPGAARPAAGAARLSDEIETIRDHAYRISAWMRREGEGRADLALEWIGRPSRTAVGASQTVPVASAEGGGVVEAVVWPPPWAAAARLAVVVGPGTAVYVDDVRVVLEGPAGPASRRVTLPGDKVVAAAARGGVDLVTSTNAILFVGGTPWARMPGGRALGGPGGFVASSAPAATDQGFAIAGELVDAQGRVPATVRWQPAAEGIAATVSVPGAEAVGLSVDFPREHAEAGVSVLGAFTPTRLPADQPGGIEGVRKALVGDPRPRETKRGNEPSLLRPATLVAIEAPEGGAALGIGPADDAALVRVTLSRAGAEATFTVVTDLQAERQRAQSELDAALRRVDAAPGEAIAALRRVADGYPFHESIRKAALDAMEQRSARVRADIEAAKAAFDDFTVFGSREALDDAHARVERLAEQFPAGDAAAAGATAESAAVADLVTRVREARARHDADAAAPEVRRLARLAQMLEEEEAYRSVAAVYYDEMVRRFGTLDPESEAGKRVAEARQRLEALEGDPAVRAGFPRREQKRPQPNPPQPNQPQPNEPPQK